MKSRRIGLFSAAFIGVVFLSHLRIARAEDEELPPRNWIVPGLRIALVELSMHAGVLLIWPETFNITEYSRNRKQFARSWSSPLEYEPDRNIFATDGDWWSFNLILHGLFGSEAYLAARGWKLGPTWAFFYAIIASFTWEYGVEAWYKQPSAIDLFWTPMGGALLGELRYMGYLSAKKRITSPKVRSLVLILLDPLGELERYVLDEAYASSSFGPKR